MAMTSTHPVPAPSRAVQGLVCIEAAMLLFVVQDAAMTSLLATYPVWPLLFARSVVAVMVLVPLIAWLGGPHSLRSGLWPLHLARAALFAAGFSMFYAAFHDDCTLTVARRLVDFLAPQWLRIGGYWYPRGGIPIDVLWAEVPPPATLAGMTLIIASGLYIGWRETRITRRGDTQPSIAGSTFAPGHLPPPQGPGDARAP